VQIRAELAEKELLLISKEKELLAEEQNVSVLREEVRALVHGRGIHARCSHTGIGHR
jgi:hypothetical protein